ncbi:MAG: YtxH domain-containing protein [Muribaculaceae bacterium]
MKTLAAFIGGAVAGAAVALLFAPEKGEDLRNRIAALVRKYKINAEEAEIDAIADEIAEQIKDK